MEKNRILFIIYTPYIGYLPKRMEQLEKTNKLDGVRQVVVTPTTYVTALDGLRADTVHLIKLYPSLTDEKIDYSSMNKYYAEERRLSEIVERIKSHNI